jgi:hypothetical protein
MKSHCDWDIVLYPRLPGALSGIPCPVPACCRSSHLSGGLGSHYGVEFGLIRTR